MKMLNKLKQKKEEEADIEHKKLAAEAKKSVNPPFSHIASSNQVYDFKKRCYSAKPKKFNHRMDPIKCYNEEMLKLRTFAP